MDILRKSILKKASILLLLALVLSGCGQKNDGKGGAKETTDKKTETTTEAKETTEAVKETTPEETLSPEQMELVKYNYYVDLNNDILDVLDDIDAYFLVVDYAEEFAAARHRIHLWL